MLKRSSIAWLITALIGLGLIPPASARAVAAAAAADPGPTVRVCLKENLDQIEAGTQIGYQAVNLASSPLRRVWLFGCYLVDRFA